MKNRTTKKTNKIKKRRRSIWPIGPYECFPKNLDFKSGLGGKIPAPDDLLVEIVSDDTEDP